MEEISGLLAELRNHFCIDARIFFILYIVKVLFFWILVFFALKSYKKREKNLTMLWAGSAMVVGFSPYTYIILAGRNVPFWCYCILGIFVLLSLYAVMKEFLHRMSQCSKNGSPC